jgi:uncharacterized membrane protein
MDALDVSKIGESERDVRAPTDQILSFKFRVNGRETDGVLDVIAGVMASKRQSTARDPVISAITINRPPHEVYAAWREYERLPRFMHWLESVKELGNGMTEWTAKLPAGGTISWTAITTEDVPGRRIAWRTIENAKVPSCGSITLEPTLNGVGTELTVEMQYDVPGSRALGALFAKLASKEQVNADLKRFKQVVETGEVVRSDASIHPGFHPARPSAEKGLAR